ncbi:gem-associated protein 7-like [Chelonus insularis]|uniref:gem-associated protein 7-like n=1 Tax=Chelonus insularis TaxID=460826 RepID=UPI00158C1635|nr:gem-associated protein 7-like [Chelonus insularis]
MLDEEVSTKEVTDINEQSEVPEFAKSEKQEARAFLRERFIQFMMSIVGKKADFHMYEDTNVSGEFRGCDVECLELFVNNLGTPLGIVPKAILRATDVISFDVNNVKPLE